jgi:hypothetical protein
MSFIVLRAFGGGYSDCKNMTGTNNITQIYMFSLYNYSTTGLLLNTHTHTL